MILGPRVESKLRDRHFVASFYKHRPEVTSPSSIGRKSKELDSREIDPRARQHSAGARFVLFRIDDYADEFSGRELAYDFAVDPRNHRELAGPIGSVVRPADPRSL